MARIEKHLLGNRRIAIRSDRARILLSMKDDQHRFLSLLKQPPARLTGEQAAWVLNCQPYDVPILVGARLLKPLGNPLPSSVKYFATAEILQLSQDKIWLNKMTAAVGKHWQDRNRRIAAARSDPSDSDELRMSA